MVSLAPLSPSRRGAIVITLIKESDQLKMPWKNRQGTTAQILISPWFDPGQARL